MFHHYPYINLAHHVPLENAAKAHMTPEALLASLYKAALEVMQPHTKAPLGILTSVLRETSLTVGTATDLKTGVYIQLAQVAGVEHPLLTVGQKWAMESQNLAVGNVGTRIW